MLKPAGCSVDTFYIGGPCWTATTTPKRINTMSAAECNYINDRTRFVRAENLSPGDRIEIPSMIPTTLRMTFVVESVSIVVGESGNNVADILATNGTIWRSKVYDCWRVRNPHYPDHYPNGLHEDPLND